jgi:sorbitol-specific phosphotransferase system component IIBC
MRSCLSCTRNGLRSNGTGVDQGPTTGMQFTVKFVDTNAGLHARSPACGIYPQNMIHTVETEQNRASRPLKKHDVDWIVSDRNWAETVTGTHHFDLSACLNSCVAACE